MEVSDSENVSSTDWHFVGTDRDLLAVESSAALTRSERLFKQGGLSMTPRKIALSLALAAALLTWSTASQAAVIDFNAFPAGTPAAFAGGVEDGFTISATNGANWSGVYGFPTPSVGSISPDTTASFTFTTAGLFEFAGLEIVNPAFSGTLGPVLAMGYVGATLVGTDSFGMPVLLAAPTSFASAVLSNVQIDRLVIQMTSNASKTPLIDNVLLNPTVPEPGTLALLGLSLAGLAATRRRKQ